MKYRCGDSIGDTKTNGVLINGCFYPYPSQKKLNRVHSVSVNNDRIFVDGCEWKNGAWKRTLRAVLECAF